ncbi:cytochrome-c oxidase, cbb3-type subunit III [Aquabacterium sp. J223]|uniref:cytochrome-c oxidase, cbb3-type subunit III n=1 Tax=Aquabacterium sp. J223 TaxID=2898431 RepID=UPI0021AD523E|nr:cytochrome-c oxidase, cbb3-type subunit III [Aquabacterium sp. J223]UUX95028.1 cytochrome-c oxidase, cbb3-type subunit III [Aquabacterium sp. J223]
MSDFLHDGWSVYIATTTLAGIVACLVLLSLAARRKVMSGDNTTGHVWDDDLRELNNPLPRWWMGLFVITIVFALCYLALYPGLGTFAGSLGWTQQAQYDAELRRARELEAPIYARFAAMEVDRLAADPQALRIGERLYVNHCAQCHGSDARGSKGFPDLTDKDWLWGGTPERIVETITVGRHGVMPPMAAAVGSGEEVRQLAHYVLKLSGSAHNNLAAQLGRPRFGVCAACHGVDGKGNTALGAPNLTDKVWLHGWGEQAVVAAIERGVDNRMPAHADKLTPEQVRVLAAYVWGLSQPLPLPQPQLQTQRLSAR